MKIIKVKIEKFKVLKGIEANLNGNNVLLLGDNGVGKSSFIQFIKIALGYNNHLPNLEEGKGYVVAGKDGKEYTFYVNYKAGKPELKIKTPDGVVDNKKSVITSLVGEVDFDIDEFVSLSESNAGRKKQVEIYKSFLDKETVEELNKLEQQVQKQYDERTEINRNIKNLRGALEEHQMRTGDYVDQEVDVSLLTEALEFANKSNSDFDRVTHVTDNAEVEVEDIEKQIAELQARLEEERKKLTRGREWLAKHNRIDTNPIIEKINNASEINRKYNLTVDYKKKAAELKGYEEEVENLTIMIESSRQAIADAIKDMDSIEGLSFDFEQLIYNGVPVTPTNLSTSEIMELGVKIKMHVSRELGILFVERAESLGKKRLESIYNMAKENGWQVIMEQVDRGKEELEIMIEGE